MTNSMSRRSLLGGAGAAMAVAAIEGCTTGLSRRSTLQPAAILQLPPLRASVDRITAITVCTRPFRAQGPRLDVEKIGTKTVVHNYGHGGSGWSLSWGSSGLAVEKAMATGERDIAVIGCGALGLTSALLLQRAGARVTIYAKDTPPNVRSSLATGVWSPDSRICFEEHATPAFKQTWEGMARQSFQTYQNLLGLPGNPVEFADMYFAGDDQAPKPREPMPGDSRPQFADLQRELIPDLIPNTQSFAPGTHSLGQHYLRRFPMLMFNLTAYAHMLIEDFLIRGGQLEITEFHSPADFARLRQKTLVNATGYGARQLLNDTSITPVRGQLARVIPQADINYGLFHHNVLFLPRRDGFVFQVVGESDYYGFNDDRTAPDRAEAELAVNTIGSLFHPA